jgi:hypothetical protein
MPLGSFYGNYIEIYFIDLDILICYKIYKKIILLCRKLLFTNETSRIPLELNLMASTLYI